jgi:RNA-binding protein PNO1
MTPLKTSWMQLYTPITDNLKLDMRMNLKTKKVSTAQQGDSRKHGQ